MMTIADQDFETTLTLTDISLSCGLSTLQITAYIQEGLVDISGDDSGHWRFSEAHLVTFQKVTRLQQDLRLNPAGAVLVLELMQKIEGLKRQLGGEAAGIGERAML